MTSVAVTEASANWWSVADSDVVHQPAVARPLRLLLAEADDEVRWALGALFAHLGFAVCAVSGGAGLLEEVASSMLYDADVPPPDIIVADVQIPGFNALNIIEGLRDAGWSTPVMLLGAADDADTQDRVRRLGAAEFFQKPIDVDRLESAVRAVLYQAIAPL